MINGVTGVRVNNAQISFKKFTDGVEVANSVRKTANEYAHKEQAVARQRNNSVIEHFKKLFGYKAPVRVSGNPGYGHMFH